MIFMHIQISKDFTFFFFKKKGGKRNFISFLKKGISLENYVNDLFLPKQLYFMAKLLVRKVKEQ